MPTYVDADSIHINPEEIPAFRRRELAQCILDMMKQFFSDPAEEERYQQWLLERKRQREAAGRR